METVFTTTITGVRTYDTDGLQDVVKEVDWILSGENEGEKFPVALTSTLPAPTEADYIPFSTLTQEQLLAWLDKDPTYIETKVYIEKQLQEKLARRVLTPKPLPWAPVMPIPTEAPITGTPVV